MQISQSEIIGEVKSEENSLKVAFKQKPKPNEDNWKDLAEGYKISHTKRYEIPPVCLQFVDTNGTVYNLASLGNFSAIIGRPKSRKTFSLCLYLAAMIKKDCSQDFIRATFPENKKRAIHIDTEQSEYDVSRVDHRVLRLAEETDPLLFDVYSLRALPPADRLFMIEKLVYETDDLGILVIDGIRDLISDINSPDEATMISSKLLKWTQERHIHIITVIHQNKGDDNARGHIGTELINKAESVLSVEKDNEISIVRPKFIRGKDFEPFAFGVDDNGLPYILKDWVDGKPKEGGKQKLTAYEVAKEIHIKALTETFATSPVKKYKELENDLKVVFQSYSVKLTNTQVIEFIAYYRMNGMIDDTGGKGRNGNQYSLNKSIVF